MSSKMLLRAVISEGCLAWWFYLGGSRNIHTVITFKVSQQIQVPFVLKGYERDHYFGSTRYNIQ